MDTFRSVYLPLNESRTPSGLCSTGGFLKRWETWNCWKNPQPAVNSTKTNIFHRACTTILKHQALCSTWKYNMFESLHIYEKYLLKLQLHFQFLPYSLLKLPWAFVDISKIYRFKWELLSFYTILNWHLVQLIPKWTTCCFNFWLCILLNGTTIPVSKKISSPT